MRILHGLRIAPAALVAAPIGIVCVHADHLLEALERARSRLNDIRTQTGKT